MTDPTQNPIDFLSQSMDRNWEVLNSELTAAYDGIATLREIAAEAIEARDIGRAALMLMQARLDKAESRLAELESK